MSQNKSSKTRNKGEVSELYAFVYILGNRLIPVVDGELIPTEENVEFNSLKRGQEEYIFLKQQDRVKILSAGDTSFQSREAFREGAEKILEALLGKDKIQKDDPEIIRILSLIRSDEISAKNIDKQDFCGEVSIQGSSVSRYLGFSIKSEIGRPPSLVNANKDKSKFKFIILKNGSTVIDWNEIEQIQSKQFDVSGLYSHLLSNGFDLQFSEVPGKALKYNLRMVDCLGPELVAELLLERARQGKPSERISNLIDSIVAANRNPIISMLGDSFEERRASVRYKISNILLAFTTGATVSTKWDGKEKASGGFIVVTKDGKVCCLELATRNAVCDYLLRSCYFETPSTSRHNYGSIYPNEEDGTYCIDMQFQVRIQSR